MKKIAIVWLLFAGFTLSNVKADELSELKEQMLQMQKRLEQLEAQQKQQDEKIEKEVSKAVDEKQVSALPESMKWVENVKLSGDFRYRHETSQTQNDGRPARQQNRIRARIGIDAKVNDEWDLGFRLASGSKDSVSKDSSGTSTNQTLGDSFSSKDIWLDLAYAAWHPASIKNLDIYFGKMKNPFYTVGSNQLLWDGDLNPEGIAAKYVWELSETDKIHVNGGGFWIKEDKAGADTSLWGGQVYWKHLFENKNYLIAGGSYFDYGNIKGIGNLGVKANEFYGNTSTAAGQFLNDYDVVEGFVEYGFKVYDMPVAVFGDYAKNIAATSGGDTGWLIGTKINKAKKPGSWELGYNYRDLDTDFAPGVFTDSDFIGGGTGGKGHTFGFKYQVAKNVQVGLAYFMNERKANNSDYNALQADLIFKF